MSPSTPFDAIWSFSEVFLLYFKIVSVVLNVYVFNLSNSELGECLDALQMLMSCFWGCCATM